MSYHYRFQFIEHLLQLRHDLLDELTSVFTGIASPAESEVDPSEVEEFLYERKAMIANMFEKVYQSLSQQPYSMQFYMAYSKELIRSGQGIEPEGGEIELLRRTLKNIRDEDIEIFLHYNPEVAV